MKLKSSETTKKSGNSPNRNQLMGSVAATLDLLELFVQNKTNELKFSDFVVGSGKPKSSVHRMLATLQNKGFIVQDKATRKYRLTLKLWRLGAPALAEHDLTSITRPHLQALMSAANETVHLAVLTEPNKIVYVAKYENQRSIRVQTQLGGTAPSYCTATGRSILAYSPETWDFLKQNELSTFTSKTETRPEVIDGILEDVRANGYAITRGEVNLEMGGVAAPIIDSSGAVVGAFGVAIPLFRMTDDLIETCIMEVKKTGTSIALAMSKV